MTILILSPTVYPSISGNALNVERWRSQLAKRGETVRVIATESITSVELANQIQQLRPSLIHAHHLTKSGRFLLDPIVAPYIADCPIVVSPGGTDLVDDQGRWLLSPVAHALCDRAAAILIQNRATCHWLEDNLPELYAKAVFIPKAVDWHGNEPCDLKALFSPHPEILFFLPAGIRPVKNILGCLTAFAAALQIRSELRLVVAGPVLNIDYAAEVSAKLDHLSSKVRWLEHISPAQMASAYASCDIVLNTSISEGLSNSVLEALVAGKPVLASDIPGNRGALQNPVTGQTAGWLFDLSNEFDLADKMIQLACAPDQRARLTHEASELGRSLLTPHEEGKQLWTLYRTLMRTSPPTRG